MENPALGRPGRWLAPGVSSQAQGGHEEADRYDRLRPTVRESLDLRHEFTPFPSRFRHVPRANVSRSPWKSGRIRRSQIRVNWRLAVRSIRAFTPPQSIILGGAGQGGLGVPESRRGLESDV